MSKLHIGAKGEDLLLQLPRYLNIEADGASVLIQHLLRRVYRLGGDIRESVFRETEHNSLLWHIGFRNRNAHNIVEVVRKVYVGVCLERHIGLRDALNAVEGSVGNLVALIVEAKQEPAVAELLDMIRMEDGFGLHSPIRLIANRQRRVINGSVDDFGEISQALLVLVLLERHNIGAVGFDAEAILQIGNHFFKPFVSGNAAKTAQHVNRSAKFLNLIGREFIIKDGNVTLRIAVVTFLVFELFSIEIYTLRQHIANGFKIVSQLAHTNASIPVFCQVFVDNIQEIIESVFPMKVAEATVQDPVAILCVMIDWHWTRLC